MALKKIKQSFILIEILVALAIISLLSLPLLENPISFCRSQIKSFQNIELERVADLTYLDIKLKLLKNEITSFAIKADDAVHYPLPPYFLDSLKKHVVDRSFRIYSLKKEKESPNNEKYKFLHVDVFLKPNNEKKDITFKYSTTYKIQSNKNIK